MGDNKSDSGDWLSDNEDKIPQKQDNKNQQQSILTKQLTQNGDKEQQKKETNQDQNKNENDQQDQSCWMNNSNNQNQNKQQNDHNKSERCDVRGDVRTDNYQNNNKRNRYQGNNRNNQSSNQFDQVVYRKNWRNQENKKVNENRQCSNQNGYGNNQNRDEQRRYRNNNRYQNRDRDHNHNRQYRNNDQHGNNNYNNQRNDRNTRQSQKQQNKIKQEKQKCLQPNQNAITLPYQSIKLRGIQIRISYKKLLAQFHNFIIVPFQDQNLTLFPASTINKQHQNIIKKRLDTKRQIWEGKQGVIIDLKHNTKQFDALFILKLPNLKKGLKQFLNFFNQINKKIHSIALPFLGKDQNITQTSNIIISFLFQNTQKWKKGNVSVISVVVEKPEQYISLKKAFHIKLQQLIRNEK